MHTDIVMVRIKMGFYILTLPYSTYQEYSLVVAAWVPAHEALPPLHNALVCVAPLQPQGRKKKR